MAVDTAPEAQFGVADEELTGWAGLALVAQALGQVRVKCRRLGRREDQMLLSLIYVLCVGGGHLSEMAVSGQTNERFIRMQRTSDLYRRFSPE